MAELAKVALDRFPGSASSNPHRLVVVARGAARCEGVTKPEAVVLGDAVRDVRERRRALVRGHNQIGVIAVVTYEVDWRYDLAVDQVVGDVEQARDESRVGSNALGLPCLAVGRRIGETLGDETALGSTRHDDR